MSLHTTDASEVEDSWCRRPASKKKVTESKNVEKDNSHKLLTQHGYKIINTKKWGKGNSQPGVTKYYKPDAGAYTGSRDTINLTDKGWSNLAGKSGTHSELSSHLKKVTEETLVEANATRAHIFHHLTPRGFEYSPINGHDSYHHKSGHSFYVGKDGETWWHEKDGAPVAHGGAFPGHKAYDSAFSHAKRLTDQIRSNELTHPELEADKKESKSKKKVSEELADFSSKSNPKGYFHQEVRNKGSVVKITASSRSGPFQVRLYTDHGNKATDKHSTLTTIQAAYKWAEKHLGVQVKESTFSQLRKKLSEKDDIDNVRVPDTVPDFDMAETDIVPDIGLDDRLYTETEDDVNDKVVPGDVAVSGRLYTL